MNIYEKSKLFCERVRQFAKTNNKIVVTTIQYDLPTTDEISTIIANVKELKSYYAGGTLCIDNILAQSDVLMLNLDGRVSAFVGGMKGKLTDEQRQSLFDLYKEIKGETEYYKEQIKKFKKK